MPRLLQRALADDGAVLVRSGRVLVYPAGYAAGLAGVCNGWPWPAAAPPLSSSSSCSSGCTRLARRHSTQAYLPLRRTLLEAGVDRPAVLETAKNDCQRLYAAIAARLQRRDQEGRRTLRRRHGRADARQAAGAPARPTRCYRPRLAAMVAQRDQALAEAEAKYPPPHRRLGKRLRRRRRRPLRRQYDEAIAANQRQYEQQRAEMADRWLERPGAVPGRRSSEIRGRLRPLVSRLGRRRRGSIGRRRPKSRRRSASGRARCSWRGSKAACPQTRGCGRRRATSRCPCCCPFPRHSLLLLKAAGEGRAKAVQAIQAIMLRMLTAMPPGKVRFTILDPVGLGENFSAFMHLADYDEQLVASRIWTDSGHIEQRLADLTDHMENVIQVYLRNEFQSIEEYNRFAGEMAEPYRVLVVADFPANFSEAAAHRLKSIVPAAPAAASSRSLSVDTKLALAAAVPPRRPRARGDGAGVERGALRLAASRLRPAAGDARGAAAAPSASPRSSAPWAAR